MSIFGDLFGPSAPPPPPQPVPLAASLLSEALLTALFPATPAPGRLVAPLQQACADFDISTRLRLAGFLAQTGHESAGFTVLEENLNYSAERLTVVFRPYYPTLAATDGYVGHPERIAARVYGNRMGNGPESTGDGWQFRGRGFIQITGRETYQAFATAMGLSLDAAVAFVGTLDGAARSAGWFWQTHGLNSFADAGDIVAMTKRINGGCNGLSERRALYTKAIDLLGQ